ncbi:MAG TPA: hypothetical protein VKB76_13265 [Ktedonobacterales bacterium]|nr:hypothetical protein [Ktedonobacterales bacterium]
MKPATIYLIGVALLVLFVGLGIFYLIPGPLKPIVFDDPTGIHIKHSLVSFALGIISILGARFAANARPSRAS